MSANLDIELLRTFHAILRFGRFSPRPATSTAAPRR